MSTEDRTGEPRAEGRRTLTVEEAARVLGVGRGTAYEAARLGTIPTVRVGRRLLVPIDALDRLLAAGAARDDRTAA